MMTRIKIFEGISLQRLSIAANHFMKSLCVSNVQTSHYVLSGSLVHVITITYEETSKEVKS